MPGYLVVNLGCGLLYQEWARRTHSRRLAGVFNGMDRQLTVLKNQSGNGYTYPRRGTQETKR